MKKITQKIILYLLAVILCIFITGFLLVFIGGKSFVKKELSGALKTQVSFSSVRLRPIFTLEIKNLQIPDFANIERVVISPIIVGFSRGKIVLGKANLFKPQFSITKSADGNWNLPLGILEKLQAKDQGGPEFLLSGLSIGDGGVTFQDLTKTPTFSFSVKDINVDIGNKILSFNPILTRFQAAAEIITQPGAIPSEFNTHGWINFLKKDMKGEVKLSELDAVYFLPLYSKYMTSNLKKGILSFKSDLVAKHNDLLANCHLVIRNLVFEKGADDTAPTISFFDIVMGGLQTENKEVNIDFIIRTKLDKPRVDLVKLSGSIVAKALGEQMLQSPQQTIENIKSVGKEFEALGKDILKKQLGIDITGKKEEESSNHQQQNAVSP